MDTAPTTETKTVIKQNGIKRPDSGSVTGKLWDIADRISETKGAPATRKEVTGAYMTEVTGANIATANTQYARWVAFHGVSHILAGNRDQAKADRIAAKEAEKVAKAKEREAAKEAEAATKAAKEAAAVEAAAAKQAEKDAKAKATADKKAAAEAEKQRKANEKAAAKAAAQPAAAPAAVKKSGKK
jgi:colicin import membrane protein